MAIAAQSIEHRPWQGMHWCRDNTRRRIHERDGQRCLYCNKDLSNAGRGEKHLDHLTPRIWFHLQGLRIDNSPKNVVTACGSCNDSRQDRDWRTFATSKDPHAIARIERVITLPLP